MWFLGKRNRFEWLSFLIMLKGVSQKCKRDNADPELNSGLITINVPIICRGYMEKVVKTNLTDLQIHRIKFNTNPSDITNSVMVMDQTSVE